MADILKRESIYLFYYLSIQLELIAPYWILGIVIGSLVSVFGKTRIQRLFQLLSHRKLGVFGLIPASLLGILSPLCLYGTLPIAASFSSKGMRHDWLAAFMMSSVLLNPQLLAYSVILGEQMVLFRFFFSLLGGVTAGILVSLFFRDRPFFSFGNFGEPSSRDTHPNLLLRLLFNMGRNIKATGPYFFLGIVLTAIYQRYVPEHLVSQLFGRGNRGFGVLSAAALGVPLYVCGGGTVPLLAEWLLRGMSPSSAVAFMLSGPATKITNLSAVKAIFTGKHFAFYLIFSVGFALVSGLLINFLIL